MKISEKALKFAVRFFISLSFIISVNILFSYFIPSPFGTHIFSGPNKVLTGLNIPENISYVRISRNGEEKELTDPKDIEKAIEAVSVLNCGLHSSNTNNSHSEEIMYVFKFKYPSTIFISGGDGLILYDGNYYKSKDDSLNKLIEITDEYFF